MSVVRVSGKALTMGKTVKILALAAVLLVFSLGLPNGGTEKTFTQAALPATETTGRPNIIFILADDLDVGSVEYMPEAKALLTDKGTTFKNAFVTTPLCCPSRSTIMRGQYAHNHRVQSNEPPLGGFEKFHALGHEDSTVATWLQSGGYRTVLLGKLMNGYPSEDPNHVPPGWDEWYGAWGGNNYYNYKINENGTVFQYGDSEQDYQTDVLSRKATEYLQRTADDPRPFFMYLAPTVPHSPYTPVPRHEGAFAGVKAPRPPSFNEKDVSDKPAWVRGLRRLSSDQVAHIDRDYRKRLQSLLALDEAISDLVGALEASEQLENTYIVLTSDNGYHMGQHRLRPQKQTAYEEDIRVPLIVRGPSVPAGQSLDQFALNTDFAPTFAELAGVSAPDFVDGRSLKPLLIDGPPPPNWRSAFLVEFRAKRYDGYKVGSIPNYRALRTQGRLWVEYDYGEHELYNVSKDPYQLQNQNRSAGSALKQRLHSRLAALRDCARASCRAAENGL